MSSDSEIDEPAHHAKSLKRLKEKDPDFYKFLKENDKDLLNFKESDAEEDDENQSEEADTSEGEEGKATTSKGLISSSKTAYIKENIRDKPTIKLCKELISAFKSAVSQAEGSGKKVDMSNSDLFNDIMKLCLIDLVPALNRVLKMSGDENSKKLDPTKSKNWKKVQMIIKAYLIDMLKMFSIMKDTSVLILLLKHTVHLIPYYQVFIKLSRHLVKKMISLWCSDEETVRVVSLIIIVRCSKSLSKEYLTLVLKQMYFSYIKNTKFTSPTTWPMINFMKRSLTEVYSLNPEVAYEHTFIYIRQMAIHLRNALTTKKKEAYQTVYNWQYVHCIMLWSNVLCRLQEHEPLKSLIYPLVQTALGTINLIPIAKYVPLRFHLIRSLMYVSEQTGTFIPILLLILDVLKITDYNKKSNFSVKPVDFSCALKVTKSQLHEAGFKESCITEICNLLLNYLKGYAHSIGFPELCLPAIVQIKAFMKECKVSKYNQQLKSALAQIQENIQFINEKRKAVSFGIADEEEVKKWEENIKSQGPPLAKKNKELKAPDVSKKPIKRKNSGKPKSVKKKKKVEST